LLRDGDGRVGSAHRGMAPRARRLRLLQQRQGGLRDQERPVVEAALGRLARLVPMEPSRDEILKALEQVIDPELRRPVTELDMVRDLRIEGGDVAVTIALTVAGCPLRTAFEDQVSRFVGAVPGVERVALDFDVMTPDERAALTTKLRGGVEQRSQGLSVDRTTRVLAIASGRSEERRVGKECRWRRPWQDDNEKNKDEERAWRTVA